MQCSGLIFQSSFSNFKMELGVQKVYLGPIAIRGKDLLKEAELSRVSHQIGKWTCESFCQTTGDFVRGGIIQNPSSDRNAQALVPEPPSVIIWVLPGEECDCGSKAEADPAELTDDGYQATSFLGPEIEYFLEEGSEQQHISVFDTRG